MGGAEGPQLVPQHAGGLLGGQQRPGGETHKAALLQLQRLDDLVLNRLDEFGDTPHDLPVFIVPEPVGLAAGLDLHLTAQPVDLLPGALEIGDHDGLDGLMFKGREAAASQKPGGVLDGEVDAQVGLVRAVFFHGLQIGDAYKRRF